MRVLMSKIRIKDFGPIKQGLKNDEWIDIKKVTVFIGNQGSGKSTIAKLISTLSWIEKALVRGDQNEFALSKKNAFENHFSYQNIHDYFKQNTVIEYHGKAFYIAYRGGAITIARNSNNEDYGFPKIMYVPSERNFVSSVRNLRELKGLPSTLYTFSDEFVQGIEDLKGPLDLPINNVKFEYQKLNKLSWIVGEDYKIKLSVASSGFQSVVPLFIVTRYLTNALKEESNNAYKEISIEDEMRIRREIREILLNDNLSGEVKQASLEFLSAKYSTASFLNIVEEPEQNLYPSSQRQILNSLLLYNNKEDKNVLVMTTHSPYLINYLTLAVKAGSIASELNQEQAEQMNKIVPRGSAIDGKDLIIYELNEKNGTLNVLETYKGLPSDENKLNDELGDSNELFAQLLEIQQGV